MWPRCWRHGRSPGHRRAGAGPLTDGNHQSHLRRQRARRAAGRRSADIAGALPGRLSGQAGRRRQALAGVRGAARRGARHQGPYAGAPRPLPGALRRAGDGGGWDRPLVPDAGGGAAGHPRPLPGGRRQDGDQEQVHDRRGDGAQPLPRRAWHRAGGDRSRRIRGPACRRAAKPHHRAGGAQDPGSGRRSLSREAYAARPHPPARTRRRAGGGGPRSAASALSRGRCRDHGRETS